MNYKSAIIVSCLIFSVASALPNQAQLDKQLQDAVNVFDVNNVKDALKNGANPKAISPLSIEILISNCDILQPQGLQIFQLLLEHGAEIRPQVFLCDSIMKGCTQTVEYLLQKGASATDNIGDSKPIVWAYYFGQPQVAEILIKYGAAPIPKREADIWLFTHLAGDSWDKNRFEKMDALLKQGIDSVFIDDRNPKGETALIRACEMIGLSHNEDAFSNISYLLEKGADINTKGKLNEAETRARVETETTPLHVAIERTALAFQYKKSGKKSLCDMDKECHFCKLILEKMLETGAHVSARDQFGKTPLHIAAIENNIIGATMLLEKGCKINDKDNSGKTPLDYAESAEMIELLKAHGVKEQ